jgi:membrane-bound metal-dependent hydrolase YbcI (DUF457 family)
MLFFFHLFIGFVLGALLWKWTDDRRAVPWCIAGAVLPDLIDKPLGHILWHSTVDDGRLLFHGLFVLILLTAVAALLWRCGYPQAAWITAGVFTHQIADAMWTTPVVWYYPLLGPYPFNPHPDYFWSALTHEFGTASEWLFVAVLVIAFISWYGYGKRERQAFWIATALIAGGLMITALSAARIVDISETIPGITAICGGGILYILFHLQQKSGSEKN